MTLRINQNIANFDPYNADTLYTIDAAWMERLFTDDWTLDPTVFNYRIAFRPSDFVKGFLAESYEFKDPSTFVVHLRQGIHWQNKAPVNGREFNADDILFHFDRLFGLGNGFTKPSPYQASVGSYSTLKSVTKSDNYTVVFNWGTPNPEFILETMQAQSVGSPCIEAPEVVQAYGNTVDWHYAIGTGPFILQDFVSDSSATLIKNPNYWGFDERYPQNRLPYINQLNFLIITDNSTALAAMRSGKIDILDQISYNDAQSMQKTNPEILQMSILASVATNIDPRNDLKPFNDIRVRQALQMSINLKDIADNYYNGSCLPIPSTLTSNSMTGWGFPYNQWPQDLKDQYAYNPTAAKKLLADAGYPDGFDTDVVVSSTADLSLLEIVKSYFSAINVNMSVTKLDPASWTNFVQIGRKHDALAMRATGSLGLAYEPITQLLKFTKAYVGDWSMVNDPVYEAFYPKAIAATTVDEVKNIVKDANEYVARQHFNISLLQPSLFSLYQPWFKGYSGQWLSISGNFGPQLISFYGARFWIKRN
jgi:peptide/nickel transport system substrate-binding protein